MACNRCGQHEVKDGLCRVHYVEEKEKIYLDNSNVNTERGIIRWALDMLPNYLTNDIPEFHFEIYKALLSLYDPQYRNKYDRLLELISWRGSAKSTIVNMIFPSYIIAHNGMTMILPNGSRCTINEGLVCILSETSGSAEEFTVRIRDEFTINERLMYFYKFQIMDAIDALTGQWTRTSFKINGTFVIGLGAGQQIRGKVKGASRPTLLIGDDIYSENNTGTKERRQKIKRWWNSAVVNSIDDVRGKIALCGTIVHEDTILVELENNSMWKTLKFALMNIDDFHSLIRQHLVVNTSTGEIEMKFDDEPDKLIRITKQVEYYNNLPFKTVWPTRVDMYYVALKYKEEYKNSSVSKMYQEYFHVVISDEDKKFKKEYFQTANCRVEWKHGHTWLVFPDGDKEEWVSCNIEFGVDIAAGLESSDDTVITAIAITSNNKRYVLQQSVGKYSIRDILWENDPVYTRHDKIIMDKSFIKKVGFVDELFRMNLIYHPSIIRVGVAGEEILHVEEIRRVFYANNIVKNIVQRPQLAQEGNKFERIINTCLPWYETRMVYHCGALSKLEYQLEFLGKTKNDDCADSLEVAFYHAFTPSELSMEYFNLKSPAIPKQWKRMKTDVPKFDYRTS